MIIGRYTNAVDVKGRVFVPAKWRSDLGDVIIVMRGFCENPDERYLKAMSVAKFYELAEELESLPPTDLRYLDAAREMFQFATQCEIDKQGRILIAQHLLDYAGIGDTATLAASVKSFELWNPESLEAKNSSYSRKKLAEDCQSLASRGGAKA